MSDEHMTLTLVVKIEAQHLDAATVLWINEIKDKAAEQGEVTSCVLTDIPNKIDFS
jgi:hypothetical protein